MYHHHGNWQDCIKGINTEQYISGFPKLAKFFNVIVIVQVLKFCEQSIMLFFYDRNAFIKEKIGLFFLLFKILLIDFNFDIFSFVFYFFL